MKRHPPYLTLCTICSNGASSVFIIPIKLIKYGYFVQKNRKNHSYMMDQFRRNFFQTSKTDEGARPILNSMYACSIKKYFVESCID